MCFYFGKCHFWTPDLPLLTRMYGFDTVNSHIMSAEVRIVRMRYKNGEMLKKALREMGYLFEEAPVKKGTNIVIRRKALGFIPNDIVFRQQSDGSYILSFSETNLAAGRLADMTEQRSFEIEMRDAEEAKQKLKAEEKKKLEEMENKLKAKYALETVMSQLEDQGFKVTGQEVKEDGTVELVAARWA